MFQDGSMKTISSKSPMLHLEHSHPATSFAVDRALLSQTADPPGARGLKPSGAHSLPQSTARLARVGYNRHPCGHPTFPLAFSQPAQTDFDPLPPTGPGRQTLPDGARAPFGRTDTAPSLHPGEIERSNRLVSSASLLTISSTF